MQTPPNTTPEPLTDPREIRKLLTEVRYGHGRVDRKSPGRYELSQVGPLVGITLEAARHMGYSGEDAMTLLAYHALLGYERLLDAVLEQSYLSTSPPMLIVKEAPPVPSDIRKRCSRKLRANGMAG